MISDDGYLSGLGGTETIPSLVVPLSICRLGCQYLRQVRTAQRYLFTHLNISSLYRVTYFVIIIKGEEYLQCVI